MLSSLIILSDAKIIVIPLITSKTATQAKISVIPFKIFFKFNSNTTKQNKNASSRPTGVDFAVEFHVEMLLGKRFGSDVEDVVDSLAVRDRAEERTGLCGEERSEMCFFLYYVFFLFI